MQEIFDRSECALRLTYVKNNIFYILVNVIVGSCCLCRILSFLQGNFLLQIDFTTCKRLSPTEYSSTSICLVFRFQAASIRLPEYTNTKLTIATEAFAASTK